MNRTVFLIPAIFLLVATLNAQTVGGRYQQSLDESMAAASKLATNHFDATFVRFVESRRERARAVAKRAGVEWDIRLTLFFNAMVGLRFADAEKIYAASENIQPPSIAATMNECLGFYPLYGKTPPDRLKAFTTEIGETIPEGSIYFGGTDPGRYLLTWYAENLNTNAGFFTITQNALVDQTYLEYVRAWHDHAVKIPSLEDSQKAFETFITDAQKRLQHDVEHPNEPKQLRPGENVSVDPLTGRVSVSGQASVMSINGLLAKKIFDLNPDREFYVEESFPLEWMYAHLRPHGLIMKIDRRPVRELSVLEVHYDRHYWKKTTARLIGDWINRNTTVSEIAQFIHRVYRKRDYEEFKGDREFIENVDLQKNYSKLRSAIAGLYHWRINHAVARGSSAAKNRMVAEADLAFRQAWALCPYSPEALFRYVKLLVSQQRTEDATQVCLTFLQFEPDHEAAQNLLSQLKSKNQTSGHPTTTISALQSAFELEPTNFKTGISLCAVFLQQGRQQEADNIVRRLLEIKELDVRQLITLSQATKNSSDKSLRNSVIGPRILQVANQTAESAESSVTELQWAAQAFNQLGKLEKLVQTMGRLAGYKPNDPETWYDLAGIRASMKKNDQAIEGLKKAIGLSDARLKQDPTARDLRPLLRTDKRFDGLRNDPRFQQLQ